MKILNKLRSNSGASMILAMVYMLFCMFIGGSVLAAASANGYRVAHLSDQQQYLDERSAALLTAEELRADLGSADTHMLVINDVSYTIQEVEVGNGGVITPVGTATTSRIITFEAPSGIVMTPFQRLMYETAVLRYIEENEIPSTVQIRFKNFYYRDIYDPSYDPDDYQNQEDEPEIEYLSQFWCTHTSGQLTVSGKYNEDGSGDSFTNFQALYECMGGSSLYDFVFDFGSFSQLSVVCYASLGEREPVKQTIIDEWTVMEQKTDENGVVSNVPRTFSAQITTESRKPVIIWESAKIIKGGG